MIVVKRVGDLVHNVVRMLEEAKNTVIQLDAHVISVLLQAEGAEVKVFQPVIIQLFSDGSLNIVKHTKSSD